MDKAQRLMEYVHTYPNTYIRFYASDMILNIDSDVAYLVATKARDEWQGTITYHLFLMSPNTLDSMELFWLNAKHYAMKYHLQTKQRQEASSTTPK